MLAQRACRLLGLGNSASSSQQPTVFQIRGPVLEEKQRLARWKVVTLKLLLVLQAFALKNRTQAALGTDAYKRIFQRAREEDRQAGNQSPHHRMINGELIGKPLKPGDGTPTVDPQMCNHPTAEMKRRGNKAKWWTCQLCQSRWERIIPEIPTGFPTDDELMLIGQHAGKSFLHIWNFEHQYVHWIRLTAETTPGDVRLGGPGVEPQIYRLAAYLEQKEQAGGQGYENSEEDRLSDEQFQMEEENFQDI